MSNLCESCGLIYTSPRFNINSYKNFYDTSYRKIYTNYGSLDLKKTFLDKQIKRGEKIINLIEQHVKINKQLSILDVGCGMGGILIPFKNKGHKTHGVDFGSEYINYGNKLNLNLKVGGIKDVDGKYDIIIYSHVFEHILELSEELFQIKKKLNKNGILYIEVPGIFNMKNYRYDLSRYFQNAHTYNFSLITLNNILGLNGFELIFGNENIETIFKLSNNKFKISNDYYRIYKELKNLEFKRKTWMFSREGITINIILLLKKIKIYNITRIIYIKMFK